MGEVTLVTGHHGFGLHELLSRPVRSFSIIRDPVSRVLSEYYYAYNYEHHRYRDEILSGRLGVEEFISEPRYEMREAQLRMIAGHWTSGGDAASAAIQNSDHCFSAIGTTERFEESVFYIAKVMAWKPPLFVKRNVTRLESGTSLEQRQAAREDFAHYFESEYRLYLHVDRLLTQRTAALGPDFRAALDAYRAIQAEIEKSGSKEIYDRYEFGREDVLPAYAARFIDSNDYRRIENYLAEPLEDAPKPSNYLGFVDTCEGQLVAGWAIDLWRDSPVEVTVARSGEKIASAKCDLVRPDVAQALGVRPQVGFRAELNEVIADPGEYSICFDDTLLPLDRRT